MEFEKILNEGAVIDSLKVGSDKINVLFDTLNSGGFIDIDQMTKVGNLFDKAMLKTGFAQFNGSIDTTNTNFKYFEIELKPNTLYSVPKIINPSAVLIHYDGGIRYINAANAAGLNVSNTTFRTTDKTIKGRFNVSINLQVDAENYVDNYMLVESGTYPSSYLRYGLDYKINWLDKYISENVERETSYIDTGSILNGKKLAIIGDSISNDQEDTHSTKHWHEFITERVGATTQVLAESGSGYDKTYDVSGMTTFRSRVNNLDSDFDKLIIWGATNDWSQARYPLGSVMSQTTDNLGGIIKNTLDTFISSFPNKKIYVISPLPRQDGNDYQQQRNAQGYTLGELTTLLQDTCKRYSIPFLDLYHNSNYKAWNSSSVSNLTVDGLHPNIKFHEELSFIIQAFLERY